MKNFIIVFVVFLIAALGCKMTSTNSTNSNIGSNSSNLKEQSSKVSDPTKRSDSKEELLNAFKKFRDVPFVTVKQFNDSDKSLVKSEQYSSVDSSFYRKTEESGEEITIIGSETFSKMNSNWEWRKESESKETASKQFFFPYDWLTKDIPEFNIKPEGEETIEGKTAVVYNLTPPKQNPEVPKLVKIWVGKENGLPLKRYNEFDDGRSNWIETFDYDTKVSIKRPTVGKK